MIMNIRFSNLFSVHPIVWFRSEGIGMIIVRSPSFVDEGLGDLEGLQAEWELKLLKEHTFNYSDIKELAVSYR